MLRIACLLSAAFVLFGCSNTEMLSTWKNPQLGGYQRILAIGISESSTTRRIFEDVFTARAQTAGVTAVPLLFGTGPKPGISPRSGSARR